MTKPIARGVFLVGGPGLSDEKDASVYLVDGGTAAALIDGGAGEGTDKIIKNIERAGVDPARVKYLILTHCHIDHSGGAAGLRERLALKIVAHQRGAEILAIPDDPRAAAAWYGMSLPAMTVDLPFDAEEYRLPLGDTELTCLYIPGHSPDSICVYLDRDRERILFGQDVHGPIHPVLASNRELWQKSLQRLLALKADVLCEGHFGIYRPADEAAEYIRSYLD